jgi:cytidylate kinase
MHISITGDLGSGKSTVAKKLCEILGYKYLSTGEIQRQLALEKGMNTLEFNKFTDQNQFIDDYIDQRLKDVNNQLDSYILDSRLGWHFVKKSFKVYVMAIEEVAASRVMIDSSRIGEPQADDIQQKIKEQKERRKSENERFEKTYGVKPSIFKDFDAVIDTSSANIEEVTNLLLKLYNQWKNHQPFHKIWMSPMRIFPTNTNEIVTNKDYNYEAPLSCVLFEKDFFIFDGHKNLAQCFETNAPFVPVTLLAKNEEKITSNLSSEAFVKESVSVDLIKKWEKTFDFTYYHYPKFL